DDAAARQREIEVVNEQVVAVGLLHPAGFDDDIAESLARRDEDFGGLDLSRALLAKQLFVGVQTRLALRLARARRHPDPLELALEGSLPFGFGLLFLRQPALFLLQPRRVIAFPRNAAAAIELEDPAGDVVEEVAIVRH